MLRQSVTRAAAVGLALLGASAALVAIGPSASAAATPTLSPATVQRGSATRMSGTGCVSPDQPLNPASVIVTGGAFVGYATATPTDGNWSMAVDVGAQIGPGSFAVKARCSYPGSGGFDYPPVTLTVVGEPLPPHSWEVPQQNPTGPAGPAPTGLPAPGRTTPPAGSAPAATPPGAPTVTVSGATPPVAPPASRASVTPAPDCSDCAQLGADEGVRPGAKLALRYAGFQPGEPVEIVMRSTPVTLGTFTADASGLVTADVTIPATAATGAHTLTVSAPVTRDLVVGFRVVAARDRTSTEDRAPAVEPAGGGLAVTLLLAGSALVVLLGTGGLVVRRRKQA